MGNEPCRLCGGTGWLARYETAWVAYYSHGDPDLKPERVPEEEVPCPHAALAPARNEADRLRERLETEVAFSMWIRPQDVWRRLRDLFDQYDLHDSFTNETLREMARTFLQGAPHPGKGEDRPADHPSPVEIGGRETRAGIPGGGRQPRPGTSGHPPAGQEAQAEQPARDSAPATHSPPAGAPPPDGSGTTPRPWSTRYRGGGAWDVRGAPHPGNGFAPLIVTTVGTGPRNGREAADVHLIVDAVNRDSAPPPARPDLLEVAREMFRQANRKCADGFWENCTEHATCRTLQRWARVVAAEEAHHARAPVHHPAQVPLGAQIRPDIACRYCGFRNGDLALVLYAGVIQGVCPVCLSLYLHEMRDAPPPVAAPAEKPCPRCGGLKAIVIHEDCSCTNPRCDSMVEVVTTCPDCIGAGKVPHDPGSARGAGEGDGRQTSGAEPGPARVPGVPPAGADKGRAGTPEVGDPPGSPLRSPSPPETPAPTPEAPGPGKGGEQHHGEPRERPTSGPVRGPVSATPGPTVDRTPPPKDPGASEDEPDGDGRR